MKGYSIGEFLTAVDECKMIHGAKTLTIGKKYKIVYFCAVKNKYDFAIIDDDGDEHLFNFHDKYLITKKELLNKKLKKIKFNYETT